MRVQLALVLITLLSTSAIAQTKPAPATSQNRSPQQPKPPAKPASPQKPPPQAAGRARTNEVRPRAFGIFGAITFQAQESFDAILGTHSGLVFGGGGQVLLPWGLYAEGGLWQFSREGERAFIGPSRELFPLGSAVDVTIRPIEITGGWRYRHCPPPPAPPRKPQPPPQTPRAPQKPAPAPPTQSPRAAPRAARSCDPPLIPYVGGGFTSVKYRETSEFAESDEDIDERFNGFHIVGGAEYRVMKWLAVGGEVLWSSVDALGTGGVSEVFNENSLGGTTLRLKVTVGR
jgi:hypothetical protein